MSTGCDENGFDDSIYIFQNKTETKGCVHIDVLTLSRKQMDDINMYFNEMTFKKAIYKTSVLYIFRRFMKYI